MSNKPETLGGYIRKILDVNKDGVITFKDFLSLFPNNAIAIVVLFVDAVVLVAEYRVLDVGLQITNNDWLKAAGFVLVSAIPFYLGQLLWLYPHATWIQKGLALIFAVGGLYTSAQFGLADLSQTYDVEMIVSLVIQLTVAYIVMGLIYILIDPNIKAWRAMVVARAALDMERKYQNMTREMLREWQETKRIEKETVDLFGDADAVTAQLEALRGKKVTYSAPAVPVLMPQETRKQQNSQWHTLKELCGVSGESVSQIKAKFRDYDSFAAWCSEQFDFISGKNMKRLWDELNPQTPPRNG